MAQGDITMDCTKCEARIRREERERIAGIASFTVKLEGKTVVVDKYDWDNLWQALKEEK